MTSSATSPQSQTWQRVGGSNPYAPEGLPVFGTGGLPISLTLCITLAGAPGLEPGTSVLETEMLPVTPHSQADQCRWQGSNLLAPQGTRVTASPQVRYEITGAKTDRAVPPPSLLERPALP